VSARQDFIIEPLDRERHDRAAFSCGKETLDRYLKEQASQDTKKKAAVVFVARRPDSMAVVGYYSLSQSSVRLDTVPEAMRKRLPRYPDVPVTLLGRLAIDASVQRAGLGSLLLGDACGRAASVAKEVASTGLLVEAIDEEAVAFYEKFGFVRFQEAASRLYLPMESVIQALPRTTAHGRRA
jgi:ribosomal protein S18 acetylase RimI-like enzyme